MGEVKLATSGVDMTYEWTATVRYIQVSGGSFAASTSGPAYMKEVELSGPAGVTLTTNRISMYSG